MHQSRRTIARAMSMLVAVVLALTAGGIVATSASAEALTEPQNVTLDWNGDDTGLDITWDPPAVIGSSPHVYQVYVQGYDQAGVRTYDNYSIVDYSTGGDAKFAPATDTDLRYTVSVWLHDNVQGWSPPGVAPAIPTAVSHIEAVSTGAKVTVTWAASAEHYEVGYDLLFTGPDDYTRSASVGDDPSYTFTDASVVGDYVVSVTATNGSGSGPTVQATVHVDGDVGDDVGPNSPTRLSVHHLKKGGVATVTWTAPAGINGAPVTSYNLNVDGRRRVVGAHASSVHVKGLRSGPARISVRAVNAFGNSGPVVTTIHVPKWAAAPRKATLRFGMNGPVVNRLQRALTMRHHKGHFHKSTRRAVKEWQRGTGRHVTGVVNDRMRFLLAI